MPHVINGIGTWYYGKRNAFEELGVCPECNRQGRLRSYETTLFFTVVFIPVIPLGGKMVLNECPACKKHRVMPLKKYRQAVLETLSAKIAAVQAAPRDTDLLADALGAAAGLRNREVFQGLLPHAERAAPLPDALLEILAEGHLTFGEVEAAERRLRERIARPDNQAARERLGHLLLGTGRIREADEVLSSGSVTCHPALLRLLIEGYRKQQDKEAALRTLDRLARQMPSLAEDKEIVRLRKDIERGRKPGNLLDVHRPPSADGSGRDLGGRLALASPVLVTALVLGLHAFMSLRDQSGAEVWFVNGLDRPYTVRVQDQVINLPPFRPVAVRLAEGDWRIEPQANAAGIPPETVSHRTGYWSRPFKRDVLVVNPDRCAVLLFDRVQYGHGQGQEQKTRARTGDVLYQCGRQHYCFRDPEKSILTQSVSGETRTWLHLPTAGENVPDIAHWLEDGAGQGQGVRHALRRAALDPDDEDWLEAALAEATPEEAERELRLGLDARPVRVGWHRVHQNREMAEGRTARVRAEYARLSAANPKDAELRYLAMRLEEGSPAFEEVETLGPKPIGYGWDAACHRLLTVGRFEEAEALALRAVAARPGVRMFEDNLIECAQATGRLEPALQIARKRLLVNPESLEHARLMMRLLLRDGQAGEVDKVHLRNRELLSSRMEPGPFKFARQTMDWDLACLRADTNQCVKIAAQCEDHQVKMRTALCIGDAAGAVALLDQDDQLEQGLSRLLAHIVAGRRGDIALAERQWAAGLTALRGMPGAEEILAHLQGGGPEDAEWLRMQPMDTDLKRILLTAFGLRHPAHREASLALARRLNYSLEFPWLVIRDATAAAP